jgi:salicylate hydroxylase
LANDEQLNWLVDGYNTGITTWVSDDRRVVSYPCRDSSLLNIVAIVPDKVLENDSVESWSAVGSVKEMVASFAGFDDSLQRLLG